MYTQVFTYKLVLILLVVTGTVLAQDQERASTKEAYDKRYQQIIAGEEKGGSDKEVIEDCAAGAAALLIGIYGYYNDAGGTLVKLAYAATQTAGVVMIGNSLTNAYRTSFILQTDKYLQKNGSIDFKTYKRGLVNVTRRIKLAESKQLAYTSSILSLVYAYNGYREREVKSLQNVFYFLSGNFLLVSGWNFYKSYISGNVVTKSMQTKQVSIGILPVPTITYNF